MPYECICLNGWGGENCTECRAQPNCPGTCSTPHGCVCSESNISGLCKIRDNPPNSNHNILTPHVMRSECKAYNLLYGEIYAAANYFDLNFYPTLKS